MELENRVGDVKGKGTIEGDPGRKGTGTTPEGKVPQGKTYPILQQTL